MFIKLYSKVNRDHCVASFIKLSFEVRKKTFYIFFFCVNK